MKKLNLNLIVRINGDIKEKLNKVTKELHIDKSKLVRTLLDEFLSKFEQNK